MTRAVKVRSAQASDRDSLRRFHHALYSDHFKKVAGTDFEPLYAYRDFDTVLRDDIDSMLESPSSVVLVAERDGEVIGYITGHMRVEPQRLLTRRGILEDWFVIPDARNQGIGGLLFDQLVDAFRQGGCEVIESTTWPSNDLARELHRRLGFREVLIKYRMKISI